MEISYIWKMIKKIWRIYLCHVHACLRKLTSLFRTNYVSGIWLFTYEVWIWTLGSNQLHLIWTLVALAQTQAYCHVMIMHHIVALHWLCPSLFAGNHPLSIDGVSNDVIDDTDEELYYLQKCQASKTPLFIPIKSHSLALLSFTALGQQRVICYLLR